MSGPGVMSALARAGHIAGGGAVRGLYVLGLAPGLLATAGKLLFAGDPSGNFVAYDPANGTPLWHARLGEVSNSPETYLLNGKQYVLIAAVDMLYAFTLND